MLTSMKTTGLVLLGVEDDMVVVERTIAVHPSPGWDCKAMGL
jgi:hypothetical protein